MGRLEFTRIAVVVLVGVVASFASYKYGLHGDQSTQNYAVAYVQATAAFAEYKAMDRIESLLQRECYEAALVEAREQKNLQLKLLSENLVEAGNAPELLEYIKARDRDGKVLEAIREGRIPEPKPYTTSCP